MNPLIELAEKPHRKADAPKCAVGDTVDVHSKIIEGDKERVQVFAGTVIAKTGRGLTEMFTVRRIVMNEGVERIFPVHSPNVVKIVVKRSGEKRRAKLHYLRNRVGKSTRLAEITRKEKTEAPANA
ncbi:MAG: 50S ribosomal protein L19 [Tepidisphaeraceae bacterium]